MFSALKPFLNVIKEYPYWTALAAGLGLIIVSSPYVSMYLDRKKTEVFQIISPQTPSLNHLEGIVLTTTNKMYDLPASDYQPRVFGTTIR